MIGPPLGDRHPASLAAIDPAVRATALDVARGAMTDGALAVVLSGSQTGPSPSPESDIDLYVVGRGPRYRLAVVAGRLVSVSWREPGEIRSDFDDPGAVGAVVPGWRRALIVADPDGVAAGIQREAIAWDWPLIGDERLDLWVAEEITGYAEEVHKLVAALRAGDLATAAVQRSVLALALASRLSVHLRMLYETENRLWERVADRMGGPWMAAQRAALGLAGERLEETLDAALDLFFMAVATAWPSMDERQRSVCGGALARSGRQAQR